MRNELAADDDDDNNDVDADAATANGGGGGGAAANAPLLAMAKLLRMMMTPFTRSTITTRRSKMVIEEDEFDGSMFVFLRVPILLSLVRIGMICM